MPTSKVPINKNLHHLRQHGRKDGKLDVAAVHAHIAAVCAAQAPLIRIGKEHSLSQAAFSAKMADDETEVPLKARKGQVIWTGPMTVAGRKIEVLYDTGSVDMVVEKDYYKPSHDALDTGKSRKISYGDGTEAKAEIYVDNVKVGNLPTISGVGIGKGDTDFLPRGEGHAIVGMGLPQYSAYVKLDNWARPFLQGLLQDRTLDENIFSFYVNEKNSEMTLGEISDKAIGRPHWVNVIPTTKGYWFVEGNINGRRLGAICDTGTTLCLFSSAQDFEEIWAPYADDVDIIKQDGSIFASLKKGRPTPKVFVKFGDFTIQVNDEGLLFGEMDDGSTMLGIACVPDLADTIGEHNCIAGNTIIRNFVTVHDFEKERLGFCPTDETIVV